MTMAIIAWFLAGSLYLLCLVYFWKNKRVAAVAILVIFGIQFYFRPVIFFFGLDAPFPQTHFAPEEWELATKSLMLSMIWVGGFAVAYLVFAPYNGATRILFPNVEEVWGPRRVRSLIAVFTLVGLGLSAMLIIQSGSVARFMYDVRIEKAYEGLALYRQFTILGAVLSAFGIVYSAGEINTKKSRSMRFLFVFSILLLSVNFAILYSWANRHYITMVIIALWVGWNFHVKPISLIQTLMVGGLVAFIMLGLKDLRSESFEIARGSETVRNYGFWLDISTSLHFSQFDAFMLALRDAGSLFEFRNGADFFNGLISWIPRSILPDREAYNVGQWFRPLYQPGIENGWPITAMGSWYVNFGYIGILVGAFASGVFGVVFDAAYRHPERSAWSAVVGTAIALLMFDGGLNTGFVQGVFLVIIPFHAAAFLLRKHKAKRTELPPAFRTRS